MTVSRLAPIIAPLLLLLALYLRAPSKTLGGLAAGLSTMTVAALVVVMCLVVSALTFVIVRLLKKHG